MACAKYGWTLHYVLWEISYLNLYMMLADTVSTVDIGEVSNIKNEQGGFKGFLKSAKDLNL